MPHLVLAELRLLLCCRPGRLCCRPRACYLLLGSPQLPLLLCEQLLGSFEVGPLAIKLGGGGLDLWWQKQVAMGKQAKVEVLLDVSVARPALRPSNWEVVDSTWW